MYILKINKNTQYMKIIKEMNDGYIVQFSNKKHNWKDNKSDYITKELFNSCIRTEFLKEIEE